MTCKLSTNLLSSLAVGLLILSPLSAFAKSPAKALPADLILEELLIYKKAPSSAVCIEGKVKNISGKPQRFIYPTADYYTKDRQYIDSNSTTLHSPDILMNNQSGQFGFYTKVNPLTDIVRLYFADGSKFQGKTMRFSANGIRTFLVVPITQMSSRRCKLI